MGMRVRVRMHVGHGRLLVALMLALHGRCWRALCCYWKHTRLAPRLYRRRAQPRLALLQRLVERGLWRNVWP